MNGTAFPRFTFLGRKALKNHKQEKGGKYKEDKRIADEAVIKTSHARGGKVFTNSKCPNVTNSAAVQIPVSCMVHRMFPTPVVVGCENGHAGNETKDIIGLLRLEKGSVTTIMENNKGTDEE